jgi:hypothetical protein
MISLPMTSLMASLAMTSLIATLAMNSSSQMMASAALDGILCQSKFLL